MALLLVLFSFFLVLFTGLPATSINTPKVAFLLKVENHVPGLVSVSSDSGLTWKAIGSVKKFATQISPKGFTAASWISDMRVVATAVNAIHLKVSEDDKIDRAQLISIVPDLDQGIAGSYYSSASTIVTDISPGTGCFGGMWSPFVGNTFSAKWVKGRGEEFVIGVTFPVKNIQSIIFENKFDGRVELRTLTGERRIIGRVLRPVLGVGRFGGTKYAGGGRIRANHPGVIDIATAPQGRVGGFQIIPAEHGMSSEMTNARTKTQWMVVGPPDFHSEGEKGLEGSPPLFQGFLRPLFHEQNLLQRFLVDVRFQGEEHFRPMPIFYLHPDLNRPLPEWADTVLSNVSVIRILFPL